MDISDLVAGRLADPRTQWSLGTFGAIAEFARDPDEPVALDSRETAGSAVTARGGIRIALGGRDVRLFASESPTRESWTHRIAFCLPQDRCTMNRREVLTELGPDADALRSQDRDAVLFDLGLGALQVDACVRVSDPALAARLRACVGFGVLEPDNPAMGAILAASPHRVFMSRLGRIEVYQPIPPHNGKSPEGPHTHVLPKLLAHRRPHSATEPVPAGWIPCVHCYPAHPMRDALGHDRAFDPGAHQDFQRLLRSFGDPATIMLKQRVAAAIAAGEAPAAVPMTNKRFARASIRVALRQLTAAGEASSALDAWIAAHDVGMADGGEDDAGDMAALHS